MTANILLDVNASPVHSRTIILFQTLTSRVAHSLTQVSLWTDSDTILAGTPGWRCVWVGDEIKKPRRLRWFPLEMSQIELKRISKEPLEKTDIVDLLQSLSYLWIRLLTLFRGALTVWLNIDTTPLYNIKLCGYDKKIPRSFVWPLLSKRSSNTELDDVDDGVMINLELNGRNNSHLTDWSLLYFIRRRIEKDKFGWSRVIVHF